MTKCLYCYHRGIEAQNGEILSFGEIKQLIDAGCRKRDRALIFTLYEAGARTSEHVNLKIKDAEFDQHGAVIRLGREHGKTGERRVRVHESVPDLRLWLNEHPLASDPEAPLWPSDRTKNQPIQRRRLISIVAKCVKRAGVKKKISPHTFRHSRATHLATVLKEPEMCLFFGWSSGSKMPSYYAHLSGRDVDETLFEYWGLKPRMASGREDPLKIKVCAKCKTENPASSKFCWKCWGAFDTVKEEDILARLMAKLIERNPQVVKEILKEEGLDQEIAELARGGNSG